MAARYLACLVLAFSLCFPVAAAGEEEIGAKVTYVTGSSVYIDAGREEGLLPGARLVLMRGATVVATLQVSDLSNHRASCAILERLEEPSVGDTVEFRPGELTAAAPGGVAVEAATQVKKPRGGGLRAYGLRGRVGLRYLLVNDRVGDASNYSQPALDFRLDGTQIAGSAWGLAVDVRSRRTYRDLSNGESDNDRRTRVYRMAVSRGGADSPWRFTAGRQFAPALSAVSIFDGLSAEYNKDRFSVGLLTGTQPDSADYGYSSSVREHGAYVQFRGRPAPQRRWSVTSGLIASYEESEINREFLYLQGSFGGPKLSGYLTQEVDLNRGWKEEAGENSIEPTSTYASVRYRANSAVTLHGGYDNRRNIRLYRDRITPITEFDDTFRRGVWVGTSFRFLEHYGVGVDMRTNRRDDAGDADTYTFSFSARQLSPMRVSLRTRASRYTNDWQEGWIYSVDGGINLGSRTHLRVGAGRRDEDNLLRIPPQVTLNWYHVDLDLNLRRKWYVLFSAERTDGDQEQVDQFYASLTYRF